MKSGELEYCEANGVKVTEIKLDYDGIVVSSSKDGTLLNISRSNLGQALTAKVPSPDSNFIDNPYKNWSDVNPDLANLPSRVYGPPPRRVHGLHLPRWLTKKVTAKKMKRPRQPVKRTRSVVRCVQMVPKSRRVNKTT